MKKPTFKQKPCHYVFLNPWSDVAFTKCPKCDQAARLRKFPLVIHLTPINRFAIINKTCRYCLYCDLIIIRRLEFDPLVANLIGRPINLLEDEPYFPMGVVGREVWKQQTTQPLTVGETFDKIIPFKDRWYFKFGPTYVKRGEQ